MTQSNFKLIEISAQANEKFLNETIKDIDVGLLKNAQLGIRNFDYGFDRSLMSGSILKHLLEHYVNFGYEIRVCWTSDTMSVEY